MITLNYSCKCGYVSSILDDAQKHVNATRHHIDVSGFLTPNITLVKAAQEGAPEAVKERARENAILRAARDRGLLK